MSRDPCGEEPCNAIVNPEFSSRRCSRDKGHDDEHWWDLYEEEERARRWPNDGASPNNERTADIRARWDSEGWSAISPFDVQNLLSEIDRLQAQVVAARRCLR